MDWFCFLLDWQLWNLHSFFFNDRSRLQMFFKIGVLKNLAIFIRKHLSWSLFFIKLQAFIWKRLQHKCFHVKIAKFLWTAFLQKTSGGCFCNENKIFMNIQVQYLLDSLIILRTTLSLTLRENCPCSELFWSVFSNFTFELKMERYGRSLRIQFECGKIRARITPNTDTFHAL